jgi:hypothetical protein
MGQLLCDRRLGSGALIGLQFVVITLIAQKPTSPALEGGAAFGTPTIVHLGTALLLSALLRAPWPTITFVAALWGVIGLSGMVYAMIVIRRMRVQTVYQTQFEDWLFHALLPIAAYATLLLSAFGASSASGVVWSQRRGTAVAVRPHTQCLGQRRLSCLRQGPG